MKHDYMVDVEKFTKTRGQVVIRAEDEWEAEDLAKDMMCDDATSIMWEQEDWIEDVVHSVYKIAE